MHFISNYHIIETAAVQKNQKVGAKVTITCPQVVKDYNLNMGGVDKYMLRQLYEINRKNMKWSHRLLFGSLDMAVFCFLFYLPYLSSIHEKANCIAILWTGSPHSLGSCLFRGLWASCLPHKGGASR